jgi:serine/threonine-protein kinase
MQSERWARLEQLFGEAIELPPAARASFLERSCGADIALRNEIEELILAHDAPGVLDDVPLAAEPVPMQPSLPAQTLLGAWRIEGLIGRGGMGEVYAARRADAAFEQRVALKLLRYEAAGQLERFHAERRILARLEHPGIARILDGGVAPDGRPYTVMEYVEGESLTAYCRAHHSSLRERLALFAQVCDAVAYAHRNLVIHRDLKPANILVDMGGKVKLLDFGIAKLLDATASSRDAEPTIAPFTPDYAAPEQLSGEAITTATDIYALGVLLFELLTDERPLPMSGLPSVHALKLLLDRDAPAPSQVVRSHPQPPLPARALVGDLDAIVAKCLRKEAAHRYETVNGLARDIERHQANEPVTAREGARMYVFGRFLRRYRWPVAGVAALVVALAGGLFGTLWQARRAETQARTSAAVQTFVSDLFRANTSSQDDPVKARQTTARELLDLGAKKIDSSMADAPAAKLGVLQLLGQLYDDLALDDESVRLRKQAVDVASRLYGAESTETARALLELAGSMHYTGSAVAEREKMLVRASGILDRLGDTRSETRGLLLGKLAEHYYASDGPKALNYAREGVRVFETQPPSDNLAEALFTRALGEHNTGLDREAIASLSRAVEIARTTEGGLNPSLPRYYAYLAQYQYRELDVDAAETNARLALQIAIAVNGEDHVDVLQSELRLGRILFDSGNTREGFEILRSAERRALKLRGVDDPNHTPTIQTEVGAAQVRMGLLEQGKVLLETAIANRRAHMPGSTYLATLLEIHASDLIELGHLDEAASALDEASDIKLKSHMAPRSARFAYHAAMRVRLAIAQGNLETARSSLDDVFVDPTEVHGISSTSIERELLGAEVDLAAGQAQSASKRARHVRETIAKSGLEPHLGFLAARADFIDGSATLHERPEAALPLLQRSLALREKMLDASSPKIAETQIALAQCELALGHTEQARTLTDAAASIQSMHKELGEQYRRPLRELQARLMTNATARTGG